MPISSSCSSFTSPLRLISFSTTNSLKGINGNSFISLKGRSKTSFPSLRTSRLDISCAAAPETIQKVCDVVRKHLALSEDTVVTPTSEFTVLGADSLDTVEIVMSLEEEFGITIEEDNSQNITTVQDAADLIEKLVQTKS